MRAACNLAARALKYGGSLVRPGITTDEIDKAMHKWVLCGSGRCAEKVLCEHGRCAENGGVGAVQEMGAVRECGHETDASIRASIDRRDRQGLRMLCC